MSYRPVKSRPLSVPEGFVPAVMPGLFPGIRDRVVGFARPGAELELEGQRPLDNTYENTGRDRALLRPPSAAKPTNKRGRFLDLTRGPTPAQEAQQRVRIERWLMLASVRDLRASHRVGSCHRIVLVDKSNIDGVPVKLSETGKARFVNLNVCGSIWGCAVCSNRIALQRAAEIQKVLTGHMGNKGRVIHMVQTFKHSRHDDLKDLLFKLALARQKMRASREYKTMMQKYGLEGTIRTLEITHGNENGWHPHIHELILTDNSWYLSYFPRFKASYVRMWKKYASKAGLIANDDAFLFDIASDDAASIERMSSYLTVDASKHEFEHEFLDENEYVEIDNQVSDSKKRGKSSAAKEMAFQSLKQGKSDNRAPFQILRDFALDGCSYSGALFLEYLDAFDGKRQIVFSDGLKKKYNVGSKEDKELAKQAVEKELQIGFISTPEWYAIIGSHPKTRGEILRLAEGGDWQEVADYIEFVYLRYVSNKI